MATIRQITRLSVLALLAGTTVPLRAQVPANLQATVTGPTTVALTWTAVPTATNYAVQRATGAAAFIRVDATTNARYTDVTAPAGSSLRYRIKANYPSPTPTTYSSVVTVTTPAPPAPPAPRSEERRVGKECTG
jgi:hypothetical protein